jgi:hypothetical protein
LERPRATLPLATPRALLVNEQPRGVAAGDFPFAFDLVIALMDVAVEDAVPGLHELANAQVLFAVSGQ